MSYDLKISAQAQKPLSSQQQKLNRLIEQIEKQKYALEIWTLAQDEIRQYSQNKLIPVYRDLHLVWFEQMQTLWLMLQQDTYSKAEILHIDGQIIHLATQLKSSNMLSDSQLTLVNDITRYYQQHEIKPKFHTNQIEKTTPVDQIDASCEMDWDDIERTMQDQILAREHAKQIKLQQKREQAMQRATQSLKMVYLKITAMIHPDREPDPQLKIEKTAILQTVNTAYAEQDLFYLLKIQLRLEQNQSINAKALSKEQIKFYQMNLDVQSQRLQMQLQDIFASFHLGSDVNLKQLQKEDIYNVVDEKYSALKRLLKQEQLNLKYLNKNRYIHTK